MSEEAASAKAVPVLLTTPEAGMLLVFRRVAESVRLELDREGRSDVVNEIGPKDVPAPVPKTLWDVWPVAALTVRVGVVELFATEVVSHDGTVPNDTPVTVPEPVPVAETQLFEVPQTKRLLPAGWSVRTITLPTLQVEGNAVPVGTPAASVGLSIEIEDQVLVAVHCHQALLYSATSPVRHDLVGA